MLFQRHLVLVAWMVAGLLLSQTVCFYRCQLTALAEQWTHRWGGVLHAVGALGPAALAEARPAPAPGAECPDALESLLRGSALGDGPRQGRPAAVANAGASQRQRQRCGLDRSAGESRSAPGGMRSIR